MQLNKSKATFYSSGYYFSGLLCLVIAGFYPTYFVKFFNGTAHFASYFHFHAAMMMLWIVILIVQPILITRKKVQLHRLIGKLSYLLFTLICVSVVLIIHLSHNHNINEQDLDITLLGQSKNFFVFIASYLIAVIYRHNVAIHARGMILTGIAFIEPALARLVYNLFDLFRIFQSPATINVGSIVSITIIFFIIVTFIIKEQHHRKGKWVFPVIGSFYLVLYLVAIFQIHIQLWLLFAKWFVALPLT